VIPHLKRCGFLDYSDKKRNLENMLLTRKKVLRRNRDIKVGDPIFWIFTKKELIWMFIFIIIASFISWIPVIPNEDFTKILTTLLVFTIIIVSWIATKKLIAAHFAIKIEHTDWKLIQWWWLVRAYFRKPLPLGLIAPFFLAIFTLGYLKPFTFFQFDAENIEERRILKRHGPRGSRRKEIITEADLGYTAASGMYLLLALAIIGVILKPYFPAFGADLAKYSIYYGIWNLLPIGQLDGTKILFGTTVQYSFLVILYFISFILVFI